jgi:hypothetical protein
VYKSPRGPHFKGGGFGKGFVLLLGAKMVKML